MDKEFNGRILKIFSKMENFLMPSIIKIFPLFLSTFLGAAIFISLVLSGQRWAANYNFMLTCLLLPSISFIITKAISGNIALSLGMVGALSIVRFRHPVKSPFELSIFFMLVTLGITINTSKLGSVSLTLLFVLIMAVHKFFNNNPLNISLVPTGFSSLANDEIYILEVLSTSAIVEANAYKELIMSDSNLEKSQFHYKFSFNNLADLDILSKSFEKNKSVLKVQINKLT